MAMLTFRSDREQRPLNQSDAKVAVEYGLSPDRRHRAAAGQEWRVHPAEPTDVWLALAAPSPWPVALEVDDRFVELTDLDGAVERICARMGDVPRRVGESTFVLGLAARLWAATLGPAVRQGLLVDPAALRMTDRDGVLQLGLAEARGWEGATPSDVHEQVVGALEPVLSRSRLSPRLLWGNVASGLAATPRVIALPEAEAWARDLLDRPPLRGEMVRGRRTTCCLYYLSGGGLCGDCVLDHVPTPEP